MPALCLSRRRKLAASLCCACGILSLVGLTTDACKGHVVAAFTDALIAKCMTFAPVCSTQTAETDLSSTHRDPANSQLTTRHARNRACNVLRQSAPCNQMGISAEAWLGSGCTCWSYLARQTHSMRRFPELPCLVRFARWNRTNCCRIKSRDVAT
ncbi:uncharacterized protein L969DRAFT_551077 [Mixia osmundae IAM 14324]|uniref:uncharacterized protein n=1 Tax=Mixia osmundae (strain CBS 9802 / IAM 14324 / JCM 22182 / KY 12970) TaxID=764103 RepID=UPI0004A55038|nr:uncharacterized protein L969DRAFT_551077 [Mixia osmundae IAM 14324]KEI37852.1 hypothetical protein L969DRAFT_551077 [Mixia osmundae IAM 14324]